MEQINYTVGDEIYALVDDENGKVKAGQVFIAKGLMFDKCLCGDLCVDIGRVFEDWNSDDDFVQCGTCRKESGLPGPSEWYHAKYFSKALTTSEEQDMEESIKEVMERELFEK